MSSAARTRPAPALQVVMMTDEPGVLHAPARPMAGIVLHVGPSVHIACERGGYRHRGLSVHGDVDIIPPDTSSRWEMKQKDTALVIGLPPVALHAAAEEAGVDPARVEILNRFQMRDPQIEHIGWALKPEMEAGYPSGRLYVDGLGAALAAHLVNRHSAQARATHALKGGLTGVRLKNVLGYIEENLAGDVSLAEIAAVAGLSVSQCNAAFRASMGTAVHQYVIRRRVERARTLLSEGELSISAAALEAGFAHQSHLAYHMRRLLGVPPRAVKK